MEREKNIVIHQGEYFELDDIIFEKFNEFVEKRERRSTKIIIFVVIPLVTLPAVFGLIFLFGAAWNRGYDLTYYLAFTFVIGIIGIFHIIKKKMARFDILELFPTAIKTDGPSLTKRI